MPVPNLFADQRALYQSLLAGQDAAFEHLYRLLYHRVSGYIFASGGSRADTKTVVHESIITLLFNLHYEKYKWREETELTTYVVSIARHKWSEMTRKPPRSVPLNPDDLPLLTDTTQQAETDELNFERRRLAVEQNMVLLGEKCRDSIDLFYFQKKTMQEIATLLGWANEDVAKKEKYRCLKKLRQLIGLSTWTD